MLFGYELYKDTYLDADEIINTFQDMRFPELGEDVLEKIVQRCWFEQFQSLSALKSEVLASTSDVATKVEVFQIESGKEQEACKELVRSTFF
jgi:hypothetical protein